MYDVVALGESLIDFAPEGVNTAGIPLYSCNPGGAPANLLAMVAKLGGKCAFIGKVGADAFGKFLENVMTEAGIDICGLKWDESVHTTIDFVHLDEGGDRSFTFFRNPGADIMLAKEELPVNLLGQTHIFHFGSVSLTDEPSRSATLEAARQAHKLGVFITYDPNYREPLWSSEKEAKRVILSAVPLADLLKVSFEEMVLLTGESDLIKGADALLELGPAVVLVTLGSKGAFCRTHKAQVSVPAYDVPTVDTTGAGDAFLGALLWSLEGKNRNAVSSMGNEEWAKALAFASAAGSLTTIAKGAIPAMPDLSRIENCIAENKTL